MQLAVFSSDVVEIDTCIEAAAVDDKPCCAVALHGLADDLFAKHIIHADVDLAVDCLHCIDAHLATEWVWIDAVSEG